MDLASSRSRLAAIKPSLTDDQKSYMSEAISLIEAAEERHIPMRLLGSTAFLLNCPNQVALFQAMERPLTDIDLVAYLKQDKAVEQLLGELNYVVKGGRGVTMNVFLTRRIYVHRDGGRRDVDIFYDKLDFCHPIDFRDRLDVSGYYTVPLSDLLLEKMQIVQINEKDIKDTVILLLEHELGKDESTNIGTQRIVNLLGNDWGFYYTVSTNLKKVKTYAHDIATLNSEQTVRVNQQVDKLLTLLDDMPKSRKWKLRSKVGTKKRWYNEIGEGYRECSEQVSVE